MNRALVEASIGQPIDLTPHISLHVLYGLVSQARAAGVEFISVDDLESAVDAYRKTTRQ